MKKLLLLLIIPLFFSCNENRKVQELEERIEKDKPRFNKPDTVIDTPL